MGNSYKQYGPFVYGDPRFLAGGSKSGVITYADSTIKVNDGIVVCPPGEPESSLYKSMQKLGQKVSTGKCGYHADHETNMFVSSNDLKYPTVGIELETVMRNCTSESALKFRDSVYSNWFHAEGDGSLDRAHAGTYGYELVTTVLPARIYRDIRVWTGFQNLISPLLLSYSTEETGLHVHVGMDWFENTKLPAARPDVIRLIGKIITSQIYYSFLPRSLARRVFLRGSDLYYCHETENYNMARPLNPMTGRQLVDEVMDFMYSNVNDGCKVDENWIHLLSSTVGNSTTQVRGKLEDLSSNSRGVNCGALNYGHNCEVNSDPRLTLEFRRGKGTTNALSIHRMIEMCVLTVMYAGHVIDNPDEVVSTDGLMSFIIENTASQALKTLAEKEIKQCVS